MLRRAKGFTLIELLAVIAIIGILASMAAISISNATKRARDASRQKDLSNLKTALELYSQDNGNYPVSSGTYGPDLNGLVPDYIKTIPNDPRGDAWESYEYETDAGGDNFVLTAVLEYKSAKATLPTGSKCADGVAVKGNGVTVDKDSLKLTPCFRLTND